MRQTVIEHAHKILWQNMEMVAYLYNTCMRAEVLCIIVYAPALSNRLGVTTLHSN